MVLSLAPVARAMRAELWPMTCSARSRSRVPPASTRAARERAGGDGKQGGGGARARSAAAGGDAPWTVIGAIPAAWAMAR